MTKYWMTLFGINFAIGVATGIILEFEFGTNWSNYSWFVGDIFGAPLAIEGLAAFFLESTFVAVMFFGWKKVSAGFHLTSTWLTAIGASLSALWILVANAWMQYPVGMEFDPEQMRNVMDDFWALVTSPVAVHKFLHTVFDGWVLSAVFVIGISAWLLWRGRDKFMALTSIKVAGWTGLIGMLLTLWTGDLSAVDVGRVQPMKLAAMEGLYNGAKGQEIVAFGFLEPDMKVGEMREPINMKIAIPGGLAYLARRDFNAFVPGINDIIRGFDINAQGDTIYTVSYAERIALGKKAHATLREFDRALAAKDTAAMAAARDSLQYTYPYFGYGYLNSPEEAVPPVALTFYSFHIMVVAGGYLMMFILVALFLAYYKPSWWQNQWIAWISLFSVFVVYICSQAGWVTAEVGRQPWVIQDLMPTRAAISQISESSVIVTFWMFAAVFTALLAAEATIMIKQIKKND